MNARWAWLVLAVGLGLGGLVLRPVIPTAWQLHVIANGDTPVDQATKWRVVRAIGPLLAAHRAGAAGLAAVVPQVAAVANSTLLSAGAPYRASVRMGRFAFPAKVDPNDSTYPAGRYRALVVVLGQGRGANFWCVLYAALCRDLEPATTGTPDWRALLTDWWHTSPAVRQDVRWWLASRLRRWPAVADWFWRQSSLYAAAPDQ